MQFQLFKNKYKDPHKYMQHETSQEESGCKARYLGSKIYKEVTPLATQAHGGVDTAPAQTCDRAPPYVSPPGHFPSPWSQSQCIENSLGLIHRLLLERRLEEMQQKNLHF